MFKVDNKPRDKVKKATIDGMEVYNDFESGLMSLKKPVIIYTQAWNKQLGFDRSKWVAFIAKKGVSLDGASLPNLVSSLMWLCPRDKRLAIAYAGHDAGYVEQEFDLYIFDKEKRKLGKFLGHYEMSQKDMDDFYFEKSHAQGIDIVRSFIMWLGLRLFGHVAWNNYKNLKKIKHGE